MPKFCPSFSKLDLERKIRLLQGVGRRKAREVILSEAHGDEKSLRRFCDQKRIRVVERSLPEQIVGMALNVKGSPFILLDPIRSQDNRAFVLAHELAHVILSHIDVSTLAAAFHDISLFKNRVAEKERDADLMALLLLMPDRFLHAIVRKKAWIPAENLAKRLGMTTKLTAARIEFYRLIHGYALSKLVAQERRDKYENCTDFSLGPRNWDIHVEMGDSGALAALLAGAQWPWRIS